MSTFTTHFTTFLPSNNHVLHITFPKTPLKNQGKSEILTLAAGQIFSGQKNDIYSSSAVSSSGSFCGLRTISWRAEPGAIMG